MHRLSLPKLRSPHKLVVLADLPCYLSFMLCFDLSGPWREMSLAVVDVETTGLDPAECRVIEVGIVRFERGQVAERWGQLINPGCEIPAKVTEITGITAEMLEGKPSFRDVKWEVYGRLRDRVMVAYNASFDHSFLAREMELAGLTLPDVPVLDPLVWARQLMPRERSHRLVRVADKLGVDDAEATGKILLRFADKVPVNLGTLLDEQKQWREAQEAAFAERRAARAEKTNAAAAARPEPEPPDTSQAALFG